MLIPVPLLKAVGTARVLDCTTVVVTLRVELPWPLAMTSAITPPATAPPMMGIHRLSLRMVVVSLLRLRSEVGFLDQHHQPLV